MRNSGWRSRRRWWTCMVPQRRRTGTSARIRAEASVAARRHATGKVAEVVVEERAVGGVHVYEAQAGPADGLPGGAGRVRVPDDAPGGMHGRLARQPEDHLHLALRERLVGLDEEPALADVGDVVRHEHLATDPVDADLHLVALVLALGRGVPRGRRVVRHEPYPTPPVWP